MISTDNTTKRKKCNINSVISNNTDLWDLYLENHDIKLRNKLVEMNLSLARKLAHSNHNRNQNVPYEDIEQQAFIALIYCVENFNPDKGYRFSTYAVPVIKGRLLNFIRDKTSLIKVPRKILNSVSNSKRDTITTNQYKEAQNDIKTCRFVKELVGNESIIYEEKNNKNDFIVKTSVIFDEPNNTDYLKNILTKNKVLPLDVVGYRNICKKIKIQLKNLL